MENTNVATRTFLNRLFKAQKETRALSTEEMKLIYCNHGVKYKEDMMKWGRYFSSDFFVAGSVLCQWLSYQENKELGRCGFIITRVQRYNWYILVCMVLIFVDNCMKAWVFSVLHFATEVVTAMIISQALLWVKCTFLMFQRWTNYFNCLALNAGTDYNATTGEPTGDALGEDARSFCSLSNRFGS